MLVFAAVDVSIVWMTREMALDWAEGYLYPSIPSDDEIFVLEQQSNFSCQFVGVAAF